MQTVGISKRAHGRLSKAVEKYGLTYTEIASMAILHFCSTRSSVLAARAKKNRAREKAEGMKWSHFHDADDADIDPLAIILPSRKAQKTGKLSKRIEKKRGE